MEAMLAAAKAASDAREHEFYTLLGYAGNTEYRAAWTKKAPADQDRYLVCDFEAAPRCGWWRAVVGGR